MQTVSSMRSRNKRRRRQARLVRGLFIGLIVIAVLSLTGLGVFAITRVVGRAKSDDISIPVEVYIDGENVTDLPADKALEKLTQKYAWNMEVTYNGETYPLENQISTAFDEIIDTAYSEAEETRKTAFLERSAWDKMFSKEEPVPDPIILKYDLTFPDITDYANTTAQKLSDKWSSPAENCSLTGYDADTDTFSFGSGHDGVVIDTDKLSADIISAVNSRNFTASIAASDMPVSPEISQSDFKTIATYTTHTTNNSGRNTNVRLAAEAVNGTILAPGEQFSFNDTVGQRTEEKGYQKAPAYAEGQVVQEPGGGVCQISSTLYNAVIDAGLQTDERTGHTFEPSYVTPGQDATVSYTKPDFKFTNTSSASIGIRAKYADRVVNVEIFGIPVLEEGITKHMESEKVSDAAPPEPTYVEDPTLPYGTEVVSSKGTTGSSWKTYIVTEKDGKEIDREYFHQTQYKGHNPTIRRNTTVPWNLLLPQAQGTDAAAAQQAQAQQ